MEIIRASKLGFCFGVEEAIQTVNSIIKNNNNKKTYVLGMLVHNEKVISDFEKKGVIFIDEQDIDSISNNSIVIVRAHGATKNIYEKLSKKELIVYDTACVFVKKSRELVEEKTKEGYKIIVLGDVLHPEIKGIISFGKDIEIYENIDSFKTKFKNIYKKYFMIFQTTFNNDEYDLIVNFINNNYDNIEIKKTICGATYERQKSVKELSSKVDVLLVVGGKKSSNTKKLYDISKKINKNTYLITELNDLDKKVLKNAKSIGITAGASTPKESIEEIENKIKSIKFEEEE